jgi:hypothetical protein
MARRVSYDTLLVRWDEKEQDFKVWYPNKCDGGFTIGHFCNNPLVGESYCPHCFKPTSHEGFEKTFIDELKKRGYDLTTLRFSIKKKNAT